MIRVTAQTAGAEALLKRLIQGLTPAELDPITQRVALQELADMVEASPKRFFGQIKSGWTIKKEGPARYLIDIPKGQVSASGTQIADIARFVNYGTANDGAGLIFPKRANRLYIPLTRSAAGGFRPGLIYGRDYLLLPYVHGIKGRHFIEPVRQRAFERLRDALLNYVRGLFRKS